MTEKSRNTTLVCRWCRKVEEGEIELSHGECLCRECYQDALLENGYAHDE